MSASSAFEDEPAGSFEGSGVPPWTGPWADDARRLFQVFHTTFEQVAEQLADPADPDPAHPAECRYCPLCRGVALLRQNGPDVLDQVAELAAGLAATLRAASAGASSAAASPSSPDGPDDGPSGRAPGPASGTRTSGPGRPPSTVRIDVTD